MLAWADSKDTLRNNRHGSTWVKHFKLSIIFAMWTVYPGGSNRSWGELGKELQLEGAERVEMELIVRQK